MRLLHRYKVVLYAVLILVALLLATVLHIFSYYKAPILTERYDCAVVFGAAVWPGYFGPVPSHALSDRTLTAADLYHNGTVGCIVLSGWSSAYGAHEVDVMTDLLLDAGVREEDIELDREGEDTGATVEHLAHGRTYVLVSNDFHLARIALLARRAHLDAVTYPAKYGRGSGLSGVSARYSREPYFVFREAVAWWYYFFATLI